MNCATRTIKYILFLFNFFCVILGCILLGFGVWLLNSTDNMSIDHGEQLMAILIIVLGSTVLVVALFGCIGAYMEACGLLISYAVILVILLVIQLILVTISYTAVSADGVPSGIQNGFDALWDEEQRLEDNNSNNNTLNFYEEWLECCGKKSPEDYFLLDQIPPPSCCKDRDCTNVLNLYMIGCEQKFQEYLKAKTSIFNTISWWLISIELVGSVFACVLVDSLHNHRDRIRYFS